MKAIILAAGKSQRMRPLTNNKPKCLLKIGDLTILERQLEILSKYCKSIEVVVGFNKEKIINKLATKYKYVINYDYKNTNSIYSLWLARKKLNDDLILINSDIIFNDKLIRDLTKKNKSICVSLSTKWEYNKGYKVVISKNRIVKMGIDIPREKIFGEYAGMIKIKKAKLPIFKKYLYNTVKRSKDYWFEDVFSRMAQDGVEIGYFDVKQYTWYEVDTVKEYLLVKEKYKKNFK